MIQNADNLHGYVFHAGMTYFFTSFQYILHFINLAEALVQRDTERHNQTNMQLRPIRIKHNLLHNSW